MFLASVMAIDIEGFCTMANHLHLIVRSRPDVAANWSAEEIARKRLPLCPPYKPGTREVAETPSQADLDAILNNPGRVEQLRLRLSNPSWLMRFLTESLARFANREDRTTGRFWEGRFKMQRLLDEWAMATCLVSVDLNPIRAGITTQLAERQHTSIFERLAGVVHAFGKTLTAQHWRDSGLEAEADGGLTTAATDRGEGQQESAPVRTTGTNTNRNEPSGARSVPLAEDQTAKNQGKVDDSSLSQRSSSQVTEAARYAAFEGRGSWLAPLEITEQALRQPVPATRTSNLGCLNMTFTQYLELLEWTGRQLAKGKAGQVPAKQPSFLQQLGIEGEGWLKLVGSFTDKRGRLRRAIGRPAALQAEAAKRGQKWIQGIALSREIFGVPTAEHPSDPQ